MAKHARQSWQHARDRCKMLRKARSWIRRHTRHRLLELACSWERQYTTHIYDHDQHCMLLNFAKDSMIKSRSLAANIEMTGCQLWHGHMMLGLEIHIAEDAWYACNCELEHETEFWPDQAELRQDENARPQQALPTNNNGLTPHGCSSAPILPIIEDSSDDSLR